MRLFTTLFLAMVALCATASDTLVLADGGLLVTGPSLTATTYGYGLIRYGADGSVNPLLDADGRLLTNVTGWNCNGQIATLGGKIYIAGTVKDAATGASSWKVLRLNADYTPDTSWGANGFASIVLEANKWHVGQSVTPYGSYVYVGGSVFDDAHMPAYGAMVRLKISDGTVDTTFGTSGHVTYGDAVYANSLMVGREIHICQNGQPMWVVSSNLGGRVIRYLTNGQVDTTYATNGMLTLPGTGYASLKGAGADDTLMVTGMDGTGWAMYVCKINPNGVLDTTFNTTGIKKFDYPGAHTMNYTGYYPYSIATTGGAIFVGGIKWTYVNLTATVADSFVWKITGNGADVPAFGTTGIASVDTGNDGEGIYSLVVNTDGTIWLPGLAGPKGGNQKYMLARLTAAGALDTTFNTTGYRLTEGGGGTVAPPVIVVPPGTTASSDGGGGGGGGCGAGSGITLALIGLMLGLRAMLGRRP